MLEIREFKKDPYWAIKKGYVWTEDEHANENEEESRKQFPAKEYVKATLQVVNESNIGMMMKSRQIMMSWLFCWWLLHGAISIDGGLFIAQGKREEDVSAKGTKGLMGRIKFMRRNLPDHLRPVVSEEAKTTEVYVNGSTIMAIPQGDDIIRSYTSTRVFMDEIARHPEGEAAWTAALPTVRKGGQLWGVSTPNGREFCYQQADKRLPWEDWQKWPSVMEGMHGYQNTNGVQLLALHYTVDPEKRSTEYQQIARKGYTNVNLYRQENELDFSLQPGEPVYGEFKEDLHVIQRYKVHPSLPVYLGWDFGYRGQAVAFFQHNKKGQLVWFDQIFFKGVGLDEVCQEVKKRLARIQGTQEEVVSQEEIPLKDLEGKEIVGAKLTRKNASRNIMDCFHYGDPSANQHNTKGETDRSTLMTYGFMLRTKPTQGRKMDLVEQPRKLLLDRSDGTPGMLVAAGPSAEMRYVIDGFKGGYHYPESKEGRADKQLPEKDGFYDHIFDGCQYGIDHISPVRPAIIDDLGDGDWWKDSSWYDNPFNEDYQKGLYG